MQITNESNHILVIKHSNSLRPLIGVLFVAVGVFILFKAIVAGNTDKAQYFGGSVNIVLGLMGVYFLSEKCEFIFDKTKGQLIWSKHQIFSKGHKQTVPFDQICSVITTSTSSSGRRHYRLEIRTKKNVIPVTNAYSLGAKNRCDEICGKIQAIINC